MLKDPSGWSDRTYFKFYILQVLHEHDEAMKTYHHYHSDSHTVCKKFKTTVQKVQNIFSLVKGVYSFWHHCIMLRVLPYELWRK